MQYFSLFFLATIASFTDTYISPNTAPTHVWHQLVLFLVCIIIFAVRGAYSFKNENVPARFVKCRNEMTVAYVYGIFYAVLGILCAVFMEPHTETRFIISTTSRCLLALIAGYFAGNTAMTCFIDYNWVTMPTFIIFWFVRYGVQSVLKENYYYMGNMWSFLIVSGLLELYHVWTGKLVNNYAYQSYQDNEVLQQRA
ncbi:hypothetical protein CRE_16442 [Caenorhabditis remanei]|uniref:Uncharacterized protein n=1 Tax=Caenorhabditis remanei TaxID=31234 RepID=E3NF81_CAERE|nr:hypothetical protein CRE_16442 [Caenorhabditis remanei]